jgi:hypothetical protein
VSERQEVTVDGLRYVLADGQWFAHPEGSSWRIPQDDDKSRMLQRIAALETRAEASVTEVAEAMARGVGGIYKAGERVVVWVDETCRTKDKIRRGEGSSLAEAVAALTGGASDGE